MMKRNVGGLAIVHTCIAFKAKTVEWGRVIMGLRAMLLNHIPVCRSELSVDLLSNSCLRPRTRS